MTKQCFRDNRVLFGQVKRYSVSDMKNIISVHKNRIYKGHPSISKKDLDDKNKNNKNLIFDETLVEKTNDSASRYYEMYKIFSKKEYGLGKLYLNL